MEKMLLKSTTRHVRIFTAEVVDEELKFHPNKLTLDLDPDNEFIWNEDSIKKINEKFKELIKERSGKDLDDYELRKIGSEIEGLINFLFRRLRQSIFSLFIRVNLSWIWRIITSIRASS